MRAALARLRALSIARGHHFAVGSRHPRSARMLTAADRKLKGRYVRFLVRDIHLPEPAAILHELHDEDELRGKVVDLSDTGQGRGSGFVVVRVPRLRRPCIVSVDRLLRPKKRVAP
jgi:hypothetical protein